MRYNEETLHNESGETLIGETLTVVIPTCTCIVAGSQGEKISTLSPQEAVESDEVAPQPPFLQTRITQSSQPLGIHLPGI